MLEGLVVLLLGTDSPYCLKFSCVILSLGQALLGLWIHSTMSDAQLDSCQS